MQQIGPQRVTERRPVHVLVWRAARAAPRHALQGAVGRQARVTRPAEEHAAAALWKVSPEGDRHRRSATVIRRLVKRASRVCPAAKLAAMVGRPAHTAGSRSIPIECQRRLALMRSRTAATRQPPPSHGHVRKIAAPNLARRRRQYAHDPRPPTRLAHPGLRGADGSRNHAA